MNRFNKRKQEIITLIARSGNPITGKALSISLNLSLRTIQAEISDINKELPLILSSNKGYTISREAWRLLEQPIVLSPREKDTHTILRRLLFAASPFQIDELAESLYMSTSTLEQRLKSMEPVLSKFHLKLHRENAFLTISGDEKSRRKLLNQLIMEEISPAFNSINNLNYYFPDIDIGRVKSIILDAVAKYDYFVESAYYNNILVNIMIALYRMRSNYYVEEPICRSPVSGSVEYQIASEICRQYAAHCRITPSESDVSYIASLLEGQIKPNNQTATKLFFPETLSIDFVSDINSILTEVFQYYMLNIDFSDYLHSFALHINEMIKRAQNTQSASNEILKSIKKNCPFIHDVAVSIAEKIEQRYHIEIADSEIGYISIHIGYLIETATQNNEKVTVFLLCSDYHHIADTIQQRIMAEFSSLVELRAFQPSDAACLQDIPADLVITTRPLQFVGKKVLQISPFYTGTDHINIDTAIHLCLKEKKHARLNKLLAAFSHEKLFFKSDLYRSKEEVIHFLGQKAIDHGLVREDFIESVLKRERISSTCFFDTFAIPHAIDMNAQKTMVCVLVSDKGIPWDDHLIHIVLMITVQQQDRKKFMELYNGIVRTLENPEKVKSLVACNTHQEFIQCLIRLDPDF